MALKQYEIEKPVHDDADVVSRNNNFDLLRLLAALQVLYVHASVQLGLPPGPFWVANLIQSFPGVPIFFVISGFLVTDSYLRSATVGRFAASRALRIYPGLIANIAVLDLAMYLTGGFSLSSGLVNYLEYFAVHAVTAADDWPRFWFVAPYTQGWLFAAYPSGVLWTLTVELSFYLVLPLILEIWRRSTRAGLTYLVIAGIGSLYASQFFNVSDKMQPVVSVTVIPYFWIFALGVAARLYWPQLRALFEGRVVWWVAAHLVALVATVGLGGPGMVYLQSPSRLTAIRIVLVAGLVLSSAFTWPRPRLLRGVDVSYGIYLYHMLLIYTLMGAGQTGHWWLWFVVLGGATTAGLMSFLLIERPALSFRTRQRPRTADPAAAPTCQPTHRSRPR